MSRARLKTVESVEERIDAWVELGEVPLDALNDTTTLYEAARRYIEIEVARRARSAARVTERSALQRAAADEKLHASLRKTVETLAASMHVAWTQDLLAGEFTVGGGQVVTWGAATAEQHERRASKLERLAAGDLTTAAMHRAAINTISAAGVGTLAEAV